MESSLSSLFLRTIILGLSATTAFALFEVWPRTLPRWLQRWALQVVLREFHEPEPTQEELRTSTRFAKVARIPYFLFLRWAKG